jgi:hypothetical protein
MVDKYASDEIKAKIESGELTLNKAYLMVRESINPETATKKVKKPSKELITFLGIVNTFLENKDIEGLTSYVHEQMDFKGDM